ncbi:hypothetical protein EJ04DRAFT_144695 [Polyplosphaeria fusca]|uniref:Uncharacterized protein n=1 Tax=Polyplosphaeria fusca TaxID=682080 RepID=A0A9P4R4W6_9PLEO|nr:hypothetical protein EJ04DRAFT_144695 [Polyplosphaeria fusca]
MAFSTNAGEQSDSMRFRSAQSPRDESSFSSITSPLRQMPSHAASSSDARGQLHRRFTTNNIPTLSTPLSPIGQQRRQAAEPAEYTTAHVEYHPRHDDSSWQPFWFSDYIPSIRQLQSGWPRRRWTPAFQIHARL